jgi:two-component system, cell cycle sensor histidine kinase and response regulator CckA
VLPEGYAERHIGIDIPPGPYVMLLVSDTGQGMPPEVKARLFEPFFTTKPTTQNTGLGLATVYGIVVQSGGYIWVDSEPDKGTTFKICLPRVESEAGLNQPALEAVRPARGSETILLVEDEDVVRSVTSRVLMNQGYAVLQASSAQEALRLVQRFEGNIELILSDVVMPDMSGPDLVDRLLLDRPAVKVLYMSGYAEGDKRQPRDNFSHALLQKPFSADSLVLTVRRVLDGGSESQR